MSKFYEPIEESVWSDIHRRSNGTQERQEDNVNNLSIDGFFQYIIDNYTRRVDSFDNHHYCKNFDIDIVVNTNKDTIIYGSYIGGELSRLMVVFSNDGMLRSKIAMERMRSLSSDVFALSNYDETYSDEPADDRFFITSKYGGTVSNSLFVKLIDFLLDNKINESVWADIHRRSNGETKRKEDELSQEAYDNLDEYIYYYAYKIVSEHAKNNLDGLCDYLMDAHKKDPDIDAIVQYVKDNWKTEVAEWLSGWVEQANYDYKMDMNESVWSDIHKRSNGDQVRKEDEINLFNFEDFYDYLEENEKSVYASYQYSALGEIPTERLTIKDIFLATQRKSLNLVLKCPLDGEKIVTLPFSFSEDYKDVYDKMLEEFSIDSSEHEMEISPKDGSEVTNRFFLDVIHFILTNSGVNESVWSDIHKRSNGEQTRKEDDVNLLDRNGFYDYLKSEYSKLSNFIIEDPSAIHIKFGWSYYPKHDYTIDIHWVEENNIKNLYLNGLHTYEGSDELYNLCKKNFKVGKENDGISNKEIINVIEFILDYISSHKNIECPMFESVWSDIHKRSNGETFRKEDVDFDFLKCLISMMKNSVRVSSNPKNRPYIDHIYSDDCNGFVEYILKRMDEQRFTDGTGKKIPKKEYETLIRFVKNNWGDCKGINEFSDKIFGKLNECDGVPGGATPANVGGMGAAYFPGPNGEPGSGDLPSPTGIVYQQVAPFGVFINMKKKKKKKKFRKEDEPCVHSPNAKVYDYVDDFREYVDRTYNNIDKRK